MNPVRVLCLLIGVGSICTSESRNKTRIPVSSKDIKWMRTIWRATKEDSSVLDARKYNKTSHEVIDRVGCCRLPYEINFKPEWREFRLSYGSPRYPCCAGDLEWVGNRTTGYHTRPRPTPASFAVESNEKLDFAATFRDETIIVAGDSIARQVVMAMMCAIDDRPRHLSKGGFRQEWTNGSDLVAEFKELTIVRTGERGRLPLTSTFPIAKSAPKPLTLILVAGGSNGLGQHWHIGKCSVLKSEESCRRDYEKAANATLLQASKLDLTTLIVIGATPTHFPTADGDFRGELDSSQTASTPAKESSLTQGCRTTKFPDHWRNQALRVASKAAGAQYLDAFSLFAQFSDAHLDRIVKYSNPLDALGRIEDDVPANFYPHMRKEFPGNIDCLHFCMHRAVWRPLLHALVRAKKKLPLEVKNARIAPLF